MIRRKRGGHVTEAQPTMPDSADEPGIYRELVADLAYSVVPTGIMCLTIVGIGGYVYAVTKLAAALAATTLGTLSSAFKIALLQRHRRFNDSGSRSLDATRSYEKAHVLGTTGVATAVGWIAALTFLQSDASLHIVATALMFGYCSGTACRLSVRPALARVALAVAAVPGIVAVASTSDAPHRIVAAVFAVFLTGAMETVTHLHRNARRHIALQLAMTDLARRDALTGLRNRLALTEAFEASRSRGREILAVHAFDLDGFKAINDTYGHAAGDDLLKAIAERLRDLTGESDVAVRMGGDEFVVLQAEALRPSDVEAFAERIQRRLTMPYRIREHRLQIGISLGFSMAQGADADLGHLLATADAISYRVKRRERPVARSASRLETVGGATEGPGAVARRRCNAPDP